MELRPQPGPQEQFLATEADICVFGGGAGGGKSHGLNMETCRFITNPKFTAIVFRRTTPMITNPGGLWDESFRIYQLLGGHPNKQQLSWQFKEGSIIKFSHLQHEDNKYDHQGAQYTLIGFDELTHFTKSQFWYLLSRNRSMSGVKPYVRATCNPDADSWVKELIVWWLDEKGQYADPEKSGKIRYLFRNNDEYNWADRPEDLYDIVRENIPDKALIGRSLDDFIKSVTFIPSLVTDNQALLATDPGYLAALAAQDPAEKARLLNGDWLIKANTGAYFERNWFHIVDFDDVPDLVYTVRAWDFAITAKSEKNPDPDFTVGILGGVDDKGHIYILDVVRFRKGPGDTERSFIAAAMQDGKRVTIAVEQEGGASGPIATTALKNSVPGFPFMPVKATTKKWLRAKPVSAIARNGGISIVRARWNMPFFQELEMFLPAEEVGHDDQVDALSLLWQVLAGDRRRKPGVG